MLESVPRIVVCSALLSAVLAAPLGAQTAAPSTPAGSYRVVLDRYCTTCHNQRLRTANLSLDKDSASLDDIAANLATWEKVLQKLQTGAMPPPALPRPDGDTSRKFAGWLETELDRSAARAPNPGRPTAHRLNRAEYTNAVRDLLALDIDARSLLPADDLSFGFDNNADILGLSPGLLERYMSAARKVARVAVGDPGIRPEMEIYKVSALVVQDERMSEDLPFGSRGGMAFRHYFPLDAEYTFRIRLQRDNIYTVRGLTEAEQIDLRVDGVRVERFTVGGPDSTRSRTEADAGLEIRLPVKAGLREVSASFGKREVAVSGIVPARLPVGNFILSPTARALGFRELMGVASVQIGGPYNGRAPIDSPTRRAIFTCHPSTGAAGAPGIDEEKCARSIVTRLARRAYRRPVTSADVDQLLAFYRQGRAQGDVRVWRTAGADARAGGPRIPVPRRARSVRGRRRAWPTGSAISSWRRVCPSSCGAAFPTTSCSTAAANGRLKDPHRARRSRCAACWRIRASAALVGNFAGQWLQLRNMRAVAPDREPVPRIRRQPAPGHCSARPSSSSRARCARIAAVGELLTADYTFVNERLARHYGIPNVYGSHFRRVTLPDQRRGGLLGHGSILTVTSLRDPDVAGASRQVGARATCSARRRRRRRPTCRRCPRTADERRAASVRARLEEHRKNPVCASCHSRDGPARLRARELRRRRPVARIDDGGRADRRVRRAARRHEVRRSRPSSATLLVHRQREFVATRHAKAADLRARPRRRVLRHARRSATIVRDAGRSDYRWSSIVLGIVKSVPFQMRRAEP